MKATDWLSKLFYSMLICLYFGIATKPQLKVGDFRPHIEWARTLAENGYLNLPHTLFQQLVVIFRAIIPFNLIAKMSDRLHNLVDARSYEITALFVTILFYLITASIIYLRYTKDWNANEKKGRSWLAFLGTFTAMVVTPIILFTLNDRLILGYVPGNVLHSPTYVILRPFALLLFFLLADKIAQPLERKSIIIATVLIVMATLAKPNFTLSILPALGIFYLLKRNKFSIRNWAYFLALAIPAGIVLFSEYFIMYTGNAEKQIQFAPFRAALVYTSNIGSVLVFLLLSTAFPLAISIFFSKVVKRDNGMQIAWINFGVGLITFYSFTEYPGMGSLNFLWGPMCGVFILFVQSIQIFGRQLVNLRENGEKIGLRELIPGGLLLLHVVSGVVYYIATILHPGPVI